MRFVVAVAVVGCSGSRSEDTAAPSVPRAAEPMPAPVAPEALAPAEAPPEPPPPRHAVFDLLDNRLLAHVQFEGGLYVAAGGAGFAKYTHFQKPKPSWKLRKQRDGVRVAIAQPKAKLDLPLTAAQAADPAAFAFRAHVAKATRIDIRVNGKKAGRAELVPGWQTATVEIPEGLLREGGNRIVLRSSRSGAAFEWLYVGKAAAPAPIDTWKPTVKLRSGAGLAYYAYIPENAKLETAVGGEGCAFDVTVETHDGATDLAAAAGQIARLVLTLRGCESGELTRAALTVPGEAPAVPPERGPPPRYVILWVMDALRADKVKVFNPDARADVPSFEALAKTGVVFKRAYSQGNESQASHASMWMSVYPEVHKVARTSKFVKMSRNKPLLGVAMKDAGFYNVGVTANGFTTAWVGYAEGFEKFHNLMRDGHGQRYNGRVPSKMLFDKAVKILDGKQQDPWFLFLGTIDTHKPWIAYEPWISEYDPGPYKGKFKRKVSGGMLGMVPKVKGCVDVPAKRDLQRLLAIYDSDVSYQDDYVGKMLAKLDEWGIRDQTMIIITADHGEELFEWGRCGHGYSLREPMLHVPLLIHYPPLFPAVEVIEGVGTMDIFPTLLDALGKDIPETLQGESLLPLAHGVGRGYPRPQFASKKGGSVAMRLERWKIRVGRRGAKLNDMKGGGDENDTDLREERWREYRFVADALSMLVAYQSDWRKQRWGVASNMTADAVADLD